MIYDNMNYGQMLRAARERNGLDVVTMSRRLHIRPDILNAIENSDFEKIPARGYAKNMVRAYAMQVGLDPRMITDMFLEDMQAYELGNVHFGDDLQARGQRSPRQASTQRSSRDRQRSTAGRRSASFLDDYDSGMSGSLSEPMRQTNSRSYDLNSRQHSSNIRSQRVPQRSRSVGTVHQSFTTGGPLSSSRGAVRGSSQSLASRLNLPILIAICAVVIIVIAIIVVVFNGNRQTVEDVPDIPISGLTNTANPEENAQADITPTRPEYVVFEYSVESGNESWIEVYENGSSEPSFAGVVEGPDSKTFDVTDTLRFRTANPTPVKCTLDGQEVQLTKDADSGYYSYTVDFEEYLTDWEIEHNIIPTGNTSVGNNGNSNSNSGNSNTNTGNSSRSSSSSSTN